MVFLSKKSFFGNFHLTFSKIIKGNIKKVQSFWLFLVFKKHEFIEVKKNNYYKYFREFLKKSEIMILSVKPVIATCQFI